MTRCIDEELQRLGLDNLEEIDEIKRLGLTTKAYPEYDEEIIEAVMNMLDISLEKAIKVWDNDNTRFDYYEYFHIEDEIYPFVALGEHRIENLEEIEASSEYDGFSEEIVNLKTRINNPEEISVYLISNGWMIYENVAIGWDIDELGHFLESL